MREQSVFGRALGAFVLNEDPEGCYEMADWSRELERGEYLIIHVLAVDPDAGSRGVGSFMIDSCIDMARERGYKAIRFDVLPENFPARTLYEKKGFVYRGESDLQRHFDYISTFGLYELNL